MAIQIVMDRTGDSRHRFDPNDGQELTKGRRWQPQVHRVAGLDPNRPPSPLARAIEAGASLRRCCDSLRYNRAGGPKRVQLKIKRALP